MSSSLYKFLLPQKQKTTRRVHLKPIRITYKVCELFLQFTGRKKKEYLSAITHACFNIQLSVSSSKSLSTAALVGGNCNMIWSLLKYFLSFDCFKRIYCISSSSSCLWASLFKRLLQLDVLFTHVDLCVYAWI